MKKRLQGFGIGLFLAGAVLTLLTQFTDFQASQDNEEIKKLQNQLQAANQEIATLNEAVAQASLHTEADTSDTEAQPTEEQAEDSKNDEQKEAVEKPAKKESSNAEQDENIVSGTILIYEGVSLYDIGKQAEDQGIVENGRELELFLYKPEYARSLQKGQFELNSSMSFEEMALILTGKSR